MLDEEERTATAGVSRFTLIEWLVAASIILILVNAAMPNFGKLRDKAKEAEVKRNLLDIQFAAEKYRVDSDSYPLYLYGGDAYFNFGAATMLGGKSAFPFTDEVVDPFDKSYPSEYKRHGAIGSETARFGDPLIQAGYLSKYPSNPFVPRAFKKWFGKEGILLNDPNLQGFIGCGGVDGDLMFNVGWLGEFPAINIYKKKGDPNDLYLDFPGQFFYKPLFDDDGTTTEHNAQEAHLRRVPSVIPPGASIKKGYNLTSNNAIAFWLVALGSPLDPGIDVDWSVRWPGVGGGENHAFREGYIVREHWAYTHAGFVSDTSGFGEGRDSFAASEDYQARSTGDGYGDFYILVFGWHGPR